MLAIAIPYSEGSRLFVIADFGRVSVTGNSASRAIAEDETLTLAGWQGLTVGPALREPVRLAPNLIFVALGERGALLTDTHLRIVPVRHGTLMIRGNSFDGALSSASLVEVNGVESCLLTDNVCQQIVAGDFSLLGLSSVNAPLVEIRGATINASNNRLKGARDLDTMRIWQGSFAVVGNLTSGPITIDGQPLPAPWAALNVTVP